MESNVATISAIDFVNEQDKDELDDLLLEITGRNEPPDGSVRGGMGVLSLSTEDWGQIEYNSDILEWVNVEIVSINSFPLTSFLMLSARIEPSFLERVWDSDDDIDFQAARVAVQQCWKDTFGEQLPGLISGLDRETVYIPDEDRPITVSTIHVDFEVHEATTGESKVRLDNRLFNRYMSEFERNGLFADLDINPGGYRCFTNIYENTVTVIGQSGTPQVNNRRSHSSYTIVEISEQGVLRDDITPRNSLTHSEGHYLRLLPMLYLYYWFLDKQSQFFTHNETIRKLTLSDIDVNESLDDLQEDMKSLLDAESDFVDLYSQIDYHSSTGESFIESLHDWFEMNGNGEIGIPNPRVRSRKTDEPISEGVFTILIEDTTKVMEDTVSNYRELHNRYEVTSGQLDKLLSFQISSTNLQINSRIFWLTVVLIVLPVFTALGGFDWLRTHGIPWILNDLLRSLSTSF